MMPNIYCSCRANLDVLEIQCRYNEWVIAEAIILTVVCGTICRNHILLCSFILNKNNLSIWQWSWFEFESICRF